MTRRELGKVALAALPAAKLLAKPNSKFGGVQIGIIAPYSFRGLPSSVDDLLKNMVQLGLGAAEMQSEPVEAFPERPPADAADSRAVVRGEARGRAELRERVVLAALAGQAAGAGGRR